MVKNLALIVITLFISFSTFSQTQVKGKVISSGNEIISRANIFIKDSYDGASSDDSGNFTFTTKKSGQQVIVASCVGYTEYVKSIDLSQQEIIINITLKPSSIGLSTVTITAGSFEASDSKKGTIFKPLDIVTTAFGLSDTYGALNTLPGTSKVGEKGELFVRGGEGYETRTFIDGSLIQKPYTSNMPDMPSRGRFSPFLFSGTLFSTGGYSAEYGQALSSALILNTEGLAKDNITSVSLMSIGAGLGRTQCWKNTSLSVSLDYSNIGPYFSLIKQNMEWKKMPEDHSSLISFRHKFKNSGMLKVMTSFTSGYARLAYPDFEMANQKIDIGLGNKNFYWNSSYNMPLSDSWYLFSALSYSNDYDKTDIGENILQNHIQNASGRYSLNYTPSNNISVKFGNECNYRNYNQNYFEKSTNTQFIPKFEDFTSSVFAETNLTISKRMAARLGVRSEYSSLIKKTNIVPRASLAYKTSENTQLSLAYGWFYQTAQDDYLKINHSLDFEKATHYIFNYQYMKNDRTFRVEGFYKQYDNLIKYNPANMYISNSYTNTGEGYSKGLELFYRDQKTINGCDFWLSYSLLDTKRNYKDFPIAAVPNFVSKHNLSAVCKYWVQSLNTQVSLSYVFSSGRTYENPNNPVFLADQTKSFNDVSLSISYLTTIKNNFTIFFLSVSNLPGFDNVYGYHYSNHPNSDGIYQAYEITAAAKRFVFLGMFISLK